MSVKEAKNWSKPRKPVALAKLSHVHTLAGFLSAKINDHTNTNILSMKENEAASTH